MSWLDDYISVPLKDASGNILPKRKAVQVQGAISVTDDPANQQTVLDVTGSTDYTPSLDLTSAPVVAGDSVVSAGTVSGTVTRANATSLAAQPKVIGVVTVGGSGGGTITVRTAGLLPNSISGLGAGAVATVYVNPSTGKLARLTFPLGGEHIVGTCDAQGNVTVAPQGSKGTSPRLLFNVRDYGATGDGSTDDTAALQACAVAVQSARQTPSADMFLISNIEVHFPLGTYKLTDEVAWLASRVSCDRGTQILQTDATKGCFRLTGYSSLVQGFVFTGGRHAITYYGAAPSYLGGGFIGNPEAAALNTIVDCQFDRQNGPAIMSDTSVGGPTQQRSSTASIVVMHCNCTSPCAFFGSWQLAIIKGGYYANTDAVVSAPLDTITGLPLAVFNSGTHLELHGVMGSADLTHGVTRPCWIGGAGDLMTVDCLLGQTTMPEFRTNLTTGVGYNGSTLVPDALSCPRVVHRGSSVSVNSENWLEVTDTFPGRIEVSGDLGSQVASLAFFGLQNTRGIWLDSGVNVAEALGRGGISIVCDGTLDETSTMMRIRQATGGQSNDPTLATLTDITDRFRQYMPRNYQLACHEAPGSDEFNANNLFYAGVVSWQDNMGAVNGSGANVVQTGSPDTTTGYSIHGITATADGGHQALMGGASATTHLGQGASGNLPAGIYCLSFYVKTTFSGEVSVQYGTISSSVTRYLRFNGSGRWERLWISFWHVGGSTTDLGIGVSNIPNGQTFYCGLLALHPGEVPARWTQPVDDPVSPTHNTTNVGKQRAEYFASTMPVAGSYATGDLVWNTAPGGASGLGWINVAGGSPGTWLTLPLFGTTGDLSGVLIDNHSLVFPADALIEGATNRVKLIANGADPNVYTVGTGIRAVDAAQTTEFFRADKTTSGFGRLSSPSNHELFFGDPIAGDHDNTLPFRFVAQTLAALGGTQSISPDVSKPRINLTGTATGTNTIDFGNQSDGIFWIDASGAAITTGNVTLKNGSASVVISSLSPASSLWVVALSTNGIAVNGT